ncbi:two-component signal transduction response regulator, CheY-like protein [Gottschalkia acidurici 9a]|uniref:Two-component signal transduction response regulator, CheY-like protein n=1 Tax=Gottschalkia acidurici (strain ATCC 7906 / DSM 604 / BCRC 14475 / CIP 104303 / KCTC 5404 / NCIMB 10678 / 9a) TaxID=1128398 RepID=K0AWL9_GOTA9|nr:response regulator transcription factor [Gottschalkia acidurici]AFS77162.1 two-component signal transduction response regulator, CheY-like protein [Gottschalkia acidurici 9a]
MSRILVLEDEDDIRAFIVINLKRAGYEVLQAATGEEALDIISTEKNIDISVLDVMLPGIDGFEVCRQIRDKDKTMGIVMLTAKAQELDKISGLSMGADDYILKPFSPAELTARIDALVRRVDLLKGKSNDMKNASSGPFTIDTSARVILKNNREIDLTQIEYMIMKLFIENEDQSLTREEILKSVWGKDYYGDPKIVDVNIRRLRRKIEDNPSDPKYIRTVWGYGYRWRKEED